MKKEELIELVASLQVVNLSSSTSALGVISQDTGTSLSMVDHLKFKGELNSSVMLDWLHKKATDQLTVMRINNSSYELGNILPNVMVEFKATAEKFLNLAEVAINNLTADYARNQMGES